MLCFSSFVKPPLQNSALSDPIDPILILQGLSWFLRKAISLATVTLSVKQYTRPDEEGDPSPPPIHIDITQVATGGISTTHENRVLNWSERDHEDRIFGKVKGRSRMFDGIGRFEMAGPGGADDEKFLKAKVLRDGETESGWCGPDGGEEEEEKQEQQHHHHVQSWVINVDEGATGGWTAEQVWGFEVIEGKRYYTRRVVVRKDGDGESEAKVERARLVYDYKGKVEK